MLDVIESKITGDDDHWVYGETWRNGQKTTDWVKIKDEYLRVIGRANTLRTLANSTNENYWRE